MKAQGGDVAAPENQVTPQSDRIFSPLRLGVFRTLWLANLVSATGTVAQGCARLGISHESPPKLAEDAMPMDMSAHQRPKQIMHGYALAIHRETP